MKLTGKTNLTINNIITPPGKLPAPLNCSFIESIITLEIDSKMQSSLPFGIHVVLCFYESPGIHLNDLSLEYIQKEINNSEMGEILQVALSLNKVQQGLYCTYNHCIIYIALTSSNGIAWSSTSSFMLK